MNIVFLFLTRSDIAAISRIPQWLNEQGRIGSMVAFVNPHLAIDPSDEQVGLENRILGSIRGTLIQDDERMSLEMLLQKRWMQIPRDVMVQQMETVFRPFGITTHTGLTIMSESFQADRLPELLTKIRPAWPKGIPLGEFLLVFPNQLPEPRDVGRPPGKVQDPEKLKKLRDSMAAARAKKAAKKAAEESAKQQSQPVA